MKFAPKEWTADFYLLIKALIFLPKLKVAEMTPEGLVRYQSMLGWLKSG